MNPEDCDKVYQVFDERNKQNNSSTTLTCIAIVLCVILFLLPKIVFSQTPEIKQTLSISTNSTQSKADAINPSTIQEQQRPPFSLFSNLFSGFNFTRVQNITNGNTIGSFPIDSIKSELGKLVEDNSKFATNIADLTIAVNKIRRTNIPQSFPAYSQNFSPKYAPKIEFPKEMIVKTHSIDTNSNGREVDLLKSRMEKLEADYEKLKNGIPHFNWSKNYVHVLSLLAFFVVLFYILLYLSRLLRYYIKLTHHFKDRKLALQLREKLKIPLEEAMVITSSSHIDFTIPKMPFDILTSYYNTKNQTSNPCCCCVPPKCICEKCFEKKIK